MILLYLACVHKKSAPEIEPYYHLQVKIQALDEEPALAKTIPAEKEIVWKFSLNATEERKDGSWNYRVFLQCLDPHDVLIESKNPVSMKDSEGIWMTFRAFPHGEFLQQQGFEQSFGEPCMGEHLDALFFLLFPNITSVPNNKEIYRQSRWKSPLGNSQMEHIVQSNWKIVDKNRRKQIFQVGYEGEWSSSGTWWEYDISAKGKIHGEVQLDTLGGIPYQNTLFVNRDICYEAQDRTYCQKQDVTYILSFVQ